MSHQQKIIIISGPSGSGQDSVIGGLQPDIDFVKVITTASRPMRPGEVEGKDYYFVSPEEFQRKIHDGEMLEWKNLYQEGKKGADSGQEYKGISKFGMDQALRQSKPVLLKVDWQGTKAMKAVYPGALAIGIKLPNLETARQRIEKRGDSKEAIQRRLEGIRNWNYDFYDVMVVNEDKKLDQTIAEVKKHIKAYLAS